MCIFSNETPIEIVDLRLKDAIIGYKHLLLRWHKDYLQSPFQGNAWEKKMVAHHLSPLGNSGIYAYKARYHVTDQVVFAGIALYGRVYCYRQGFRAEKAELRKIVVTQTAYHPSGLKRLAKTYPTVPIHNKRGRLLFNGVET